MGCKCNEIASNASKYTDEDTFEKMDSAKKVGAFVRKIIIYILIFIILILSIPILLIVAVFRLFIGKGININLKKILNIHGKRK